MSWRVSTEFVERSEERPTIGRFSSCIMLTPAIIKNDIDTVERIIQDITLGDSYRMGHLIWVDLCATALKNRYLAMAKLLLPPESIANKFRDDVTNIDMLNAAIESNFMEGVKFLHSQGMPLYYSLPGQRYWSAMVKCVENKKFEVLKYLLELKDLNTVPNKAETVLMLCCRQLNIESLKMLLNSELIHTINQQTGEFYFSALHCYFIRRKSGRVRACVKLLVEAGADVNLQDRKGRTPIILAAKRGMVTMVMYLAQNGADLDIRPNNCTLLHDLADSREKVESYDKCIQLLITRGIDINEVGVFNDKTKSALHLAASKGNEKMVKSLIKSNCDVNIKVGYDKESVLSESIRRYQTAIVALLIEAGCDVNSADRNGVTPLMECLKVNAKYNKGSFFLEYLLKAGANVNQCDKTGQTPLMIAVTFKDRIMVDILLKAGADLKPRDELGRNSIFLAVFFNVRLVWNVLLKFANLRGEAERFVNASDINGKTCLMVAAERRRKAIIKDLLIAGCKINVQDHGGKTALMFAVDNWDKTILSLLLQKGAEPNICDADGKTALMVAGEKQNEIHCKELLKSRASVYHIDRDGNTALMIAVKMNNKNTRVTQILLNAGADVNLRDNNRKTPLMVAIRCLNISILECLLNAGADINKTDTDGRSAIPFSREWIHCLNLLLINECHTSLDTPGKHWTTLFELLLDTEETDLIWYLVAENCSFRGWDIRRVKELFQFPDILMLSKILFESGAPKIKVLSVLSGLPDPDESQLNVFHDFCKSRSLRSRCRREIRSCIGAGISNKITQVGLPK